jgi:hypothetical protein
MMLRLRLTPLAADLVVGIYRCDGEDARMPARTRFLHPDAARAYASIASWAVVSDMLRSPESSLEAVRRGRGAAAPGYSAHNFGFAIDLDLPASCRNLGVERGKGPKAELDAEMESIGWFCHRRDHKLESEAWHYNYLGVGTVIAPRFRSSAGFVESRIQALYGDLLEPDDSDCQAALGRLRMYHGAIDGDVGPLTREATRVFQRAWELRDTGVLDARTRRTMALVACERDVQVEDA